MYEPHAYFTHKSRPSHDVNKAAKQEKLFVGSDHRARVVEKAYVIYDEVKILIIRRKCTGINAVFGSHDNAFCSTGLLRSLKDALRSQFVRYSLLYLSSSKTSRSSNTARVFFELLL